MTNRFEFNTRIESNNFAYLFPPSRPKGKNLYSQNCKINKFELFLQ